MTVGVSAGECNIGTEGELDVMVMGVGTDGKAINAWDEVRLSGEGNGQTIRIVDANGDEVVDETWTCTRCFGVGLPTEFTSERFGVPSAYSGLTSDDFSDRDWVPINGGKALIILEEDGTSTGNNTPNNWQAAIDDPESFGVNEVSADISIGDIQDNYCPGDSGSIDVRVDNTSYCSGLTNVQATITNNITGSTSTVTLGGWRDVPDGNISWGSVPEEAKTATLEFDIPEDAPLGTNQDIVTVEVTADGINGVVTTKTGAIGSFPENLNLQPVDDITGLCPEDTVEPRIVGQNSGKCPEDLRVRITNNFNDEVIETDASTISAGVSTAGTHEYRVRYDVPPGSIGQTVTYTAELVRSDGVVDRIQYNIESGDASIEIDNIENPNRACPGEDIRLNVNARNSGSCDGLASARITNDFNTNVLNSSTETVRANDSRGFRFEDIIPTEAAGGITYTVQLLDVNGNPMDSGQFTIAIGSTDITISNVDFPDELCVGVQESWSLEATNGGECDVDVALGISDEQTESIDILGTTSVRSDGSSTFREDIEVPPEQLALGTKEYTLHTLIEEPEGMVSADNVVQTVTLNDADIGLAGINAPSERCIGEDITAGFTVSNDGNCSGEYRILVQDSISGNEQLVKRDTVRSNGRTTATFNDVMPSGAIESGSIEYQYDVQQLRPEGFTTVSDGSFSVNVRTSNLNITEVSSPDAACVGSNISSTIVLSNQSVCGAQYRVILDKPFRPGTEVIQESDITANTDINISFGDTVPQEAASSETIQYGISVEVKEFEGDNYSEIASTNIPLNILQSIINVTNIDAPSQQCIGTTASIGIGIENTGDCDSRYRASIENINGDGSAQSESSNISPGSSITITLDDELGSELSDNQAAQYEVVVEKRFNENNEWVTADIVNPSIQLLKPEVSIQSNTYPDFDTPGDKVYELQLSNQSECSTNVDVTISGNTLNKQISGQSTISVIDEVSISDEPVMREVQVSDNVLQSNVDSLEHTVSPHRYISVDQSDGTLEIVGGFESESGYSGTIAGTAISEGNNLEDEDRVLGALGVKSITGTAVSESSNKDTINFGALKGLTIQSTEPVTFILDGDIKGQGRTYKHTTPSTEAITVEGMSIEADVNTFSGPMSNAGTLRRIVGLSPRVASKPFITLDR